MKSGLWKRMFPSGNRVYLYVHARLRLGHKTTKTLRLKKTFKIIKPNLQPKKNPFLSHPKEPETQKLGHFLQTGSPGLKPLCQVRLRPGDAVGAHVEFWVPKIPQPWKPMCWSGITTLHWPSFSRNFEKFSLQVYCWIKTLPCSWYKDSLNSASYRLDNLTKV